MALAAGYEHDANGSYAFSKETKNQLRAILGDHTAQLVTAELVRLLTDHTEIQKARSVSRKTSPADLERQVRKLIKSFQSAVQCIDGAPPSVRTFLDRPMTLGEYGRSETTWGTLIAARARLRHSLQRLEFRPKPKRGRPNEQWREWLSINVAGTLKTNGVLVATSRDGKFGRVLSAVLGDFYGDSAPAELFPLIKTASHFIKHSTAEDARFLLVQ